MNAESSGQLVLRHEQNLAGGLALFQVNLGLSGVGQRIGVLGAKFELAFCGPSEHVTGAPLELSARGDVVPKRGPGEEKRTLAVEQNGIEGRNRAAGCAEQ